MKAVELLIKNGANINAANTNGTTPLMVAAKAGNLNKNENPNN